ncbi:hypothetical protein ACU8KH_03422 [Lachancea thermotolerans]
MIDSDLTSASPESALWKLALYILNGEDRPRKVSSNITPDAKYALMRRIAITVVLSAVTT